MFKVGDIVRYIRVDTEEEKSTGWYPPIGTIGRVVEASSIDIRVQWKEGTKPGAWWCMNEHVEIIHGWIPSGIFGDLAQCPFCGQKNHSLSYVSDWVFCPYCGERLKQI